MSIADVEQVDDQGAAASDQHDADGFAGLLADEFTFTDVSIPEPMHACEQVREYMESWFTAFPDMRTRTTNRVSVRITSPGKWSSRRRIPVPC